MTRYELLVQIEEDKYYLDTFEYEPISLNYDIANIKDISGRNSSYSKTIRLPDSQSNRNVLGFITNLSVDSTIDANKAIKAWVLVDTIPVFEGNLQIKKFQKNFKTGEFDIEVVIFADNDTFFTTIGEKYISDLDLSAYNHDWTANNIRFSWTQSTGFPWRYPLIDYGSNWSISDLNGLATPGATQGVATQSLSVDEFFPAISRKIIFDRIFQEAGFNYESDFLNSDYFKNEYIPFSGVKLPGRSDSEQLVFKAAGTQSQSIDTAPTSGGQTGITDTIIEAMDFEDPNNNWDDSNYWYENTSGDTLSVSFDILAKYQMVLPLGLTRFRVWSSLNADGSSNSNWASGTGRLISSSPILYYKVQVIGSPTLINTADDGSGVYTSFFSTPFINIRNGEKVRFTFFTQNLFYVPSLPFVDLQLSNISSKINPFATIGSSLQVSNILPKKVKQRDFILSACREYNLYIEPSKEYQNTLIIEPRDDYYGKGSIKNWTNKLDLNQPIEVDILAETQNKITTFTHKEDKDYLNQNYKQSFNEIYGQYDFDSGNEFAKSNNKRIESIFSPTPLNLVPNSFGLIIPLITKDTLFSYNLDSKGRLDTNIRTLQWGGLVEFNNDFDRVSFDGQYITKNGNFAYPYAGHLDNPYSPNFDNNFGDPIDVFFPNNGITTNNLFNRFWYKTMLELTNKDSRILTANFYLTPEDIYNFRFNDKIYIFFDGSGQYYKVNKIFDFDPGSSKTTKVQLLRADEVQVNTFTPKFIGRGRGGIKVPIRTTINIGKVETGIVDTGNNLTDGEQIIVNGYSNDIGGIKIIANGDSNIIKSTGENQIVNGNGNEIDELVSNTIVFGNNNQVGTFSQNVLVFGNNNEIYGASGSTPSNIFVIGNDIVATQSNTNYIGGNTIFSGTISFSGVSIEDLPAADAIGFYETKGGSNYYPYEGRTQSFRFGNDGPYFKVVSSDWNLFSSPALKSIVIDGGTPSNNRIQIVSDEKISSALIIGGEDNLIYVDGTSPSLGTPRNVMIQNSDESYISTATDTDNIMILNSKDSYISGASFSNIIGAIGGTISNATNTTIIGVNNITATESNTLYTNIVRNTFDKYLGDSSPSNLVVTQRSGWTYSYDIGLMGGRVEVQVGSVPGGGNTILFGIAPDNNQCRKFYAVVSPASSNAVGLGLWVDDSYFTPNELAAYIRWTTAPTTGETYKFNVVINPLY